MGEDGVGAGAIDKTPPHPSSLHFLVHKDERKVEANNRAG